MFNLAMSRHQDPIPEMPRKGSPAPELHRSIFPGPELWTCWEGCHWT